VTKADYQDVVGRQLNEHAAALNRAAAVREALTSYARGLTGG
jgi:hypothetical protein